MPLVNLPQSHLNESIREVGEGSWLISNTLLLTHSSSPPPDKIPTDRECWSDSNGGHFALSTAPEPLPNSKPLTEGSSYILRVHAVDNQAAVWRVGEAFIKAHHMDYSHVTREHVTLQFLKDRRPQGFEFPDVYYHFETESRYFLVVSRIPGQLLEEAWPNMDETLRQYYIGKVADVCNQLAAWKSDIIGGVDGHQLLERYLVKGNSKMADALSPQQLLKNCTEMSMDVSKFVFYHCDLGPTNLLVNTSTGSLGIIVGSLLATFLSNGLEQNFDSRPEWISTIGMRTPKRTGAAELLSIWKRWATAMSWMHGGSFRTASRQWCQGLDSISLNITLS